MLFATIKETMCGWVKITFLKHSLQTNIGMLQSVFCHFPFDDRINLRGLHKPYWCCLCLRGDDGDTFHHSYRITLIEG